MPAFAGMTALGSIADVLTSWQKAIVEYRAIIAIVVGTALLLWPTSHAKRAIRKHGNKLRELRSGAKESYFEERRSLEAYPPVRREVWWRLLGVGLAVAGLLQLFCK